MEVFHSFEASTYLTSCPSHGGNKKGKNGKRGEKQQQQRNQNNNNKTKTTTKNKKKTPTNQQKRRWKNSGLKEQLLASLIAKVHGSKPWNSLGKVAELP